MNISASHMRKLHNKAPFGILLMLLGLALYALSDAFVKQLMGSYSVPQTTFLRAFSRLVPLSLAIFWQGGFTHVFQTAHPKRHLFRLGVNLAYTYCFMFAVSRSCLTSIYTLAYTSSFFMIFLSATLLKEKVSKEKWFAVAIGMLGVLIALKPDSSVFEYAGLFVLLGTFLGSLNKILMRRLASTEHSLAIAIYPNITMILVTFPFLLFTWQPLSVQDWGTFGIVGVITAMGQYLLAHSLRYAGGSTLAPIDYSNLFWVMLLDFFWWGQMPKGHTLIGALIIISSNLFILYRSRKEQKLEKIPRVEKTL